MSVEQIQPVIIELVASGHEKSARVNFWAAAFAFGISLISKEPAVRAIAAIAGITFGARGIIDSSRANNFRD